MCDKTRFPGKSTCEVLTLGNYDWFKEFENTTLNKRGEDYEFRKNAIATLLWEKTC